MSENIEQLGEGAVPTTAENTTTEPVADHETALPPAPDGPSPEEVSPAVAPEAPATTPEVSGQPQPEENTEGVDSKVEAMSREKPEEMAGPSVDETPEASLVAEGTTEGEARPVVEAEAITEGEATTESEATAEAEATSEGAEGTERPEPKRRRRGGQRKVDTEKLATLEPGTMLSGTVRSIQTYGAFVDIGVGTDGLVHISELKDGYVEKVEDVVKPGDTVEVRVKEVDLERNRISLTMRAERPARAERKPAEEKEAGPKRIRLRELEEGQEYTGRVASIVDFGAFVDIGAETDGLVHISELSEDRVNNVRDVLQEGQEVKVRVLAVDRGRKRISLTMRERVVEEPLEYEEEATNEPFLSSMELAFARAAEERKKDKPRRRRDKGGQGDELDDVIIRTLRDHRG